MKLRKIALVMFLALAPLTGIALTARTAEACWACTSGPPFPEECVFTGAQPGAAECWIDIANCRTSGWCLGE